jgi:hypothetical protein
MASNLIRNGAKLVVGLVAALLVSCSNQHPTTAPLPAAIQAQTTYRLQVLTDPSDRITVASSPASADGRYAGGAAVELTATCAVGTVHWQTTSLGRGVVETITNQPVTTLSVTMDKDQVVFVRCVTRLGG